MSALGLFAMGLLVTVIVGGALSLLVLGAILDGRDQDRRDTELEPPRLTTLAEARRPAA
jgi:hypothetical protein